MTMTHYMELLATNQPWNLILFMAIPVVLAETVAVTELAILFTRSFTGWVSTLNRVAGAVLGVYFVGVFFYLLKNAVLPITTAGEWRGIADIIAVGSYLLAVIPLFSITLIEANLLARNQSEMDKLKLHAIMVGIFLVLAHIAMIFGMLDPSLFTGHGMGEMTM